MASKKPIPQTAPYFFFQESLNDPYWIALLVKFIEFRANKLRFDSSKKPIFKKNIYNYLNGRFECRPSKEIVNILKEIKEDLFNEQSSIIYTKENVLEFKKNFSKVIGEGLAQMI